MDLVTVNARRGKTGKSGCIDSRDIAVFNFRPDVIVFVSREEVSEVVDVQQNQHRLLPGHRS